MRKLTEDDLAAVIGVVHKGFVIQKARVKDGDFSDSNHYGIVLARKDDGHFVTWQFHLEDEAPCYYWGRYTDDPEAALKDYETRS